MIYINQEGAIAPSRIALVKLHPCPPLSELHPHLLRKVRVVSESCRFLYSILFL